MGKKCKISEQQRYVNSLQLLFTPELYKKKFSTPAFRYWFWHPHNYCYRMSPERLIVKLLLTLRRGIGPTQDHWRKAHTTYSMLFLPSFVYTAA